MAYEEILFQVEEHVATITLYRPDAFNAISDRMRKDLREAIACIHCDSNIRIVVITGAGKSFCAGGDVKLMKERILQKIPYRQRLEVYRRDVAAMVRELKSIRQPVIAAINGAAFGAGCSIAMLCDLRIAADHAKFGLPFGKRGLIPDWGATYFLPRLVGISKALELTTTGRSFDANTALQIGFVNAVVPGGELTEYVRGFCRDMLQGSPLSMRYTKQAMYHALSCEMDTALEQESELQSVCYCSNDHEEGVDCFLEKREANFSGT